jgi:hypothetical protein
MTKLLSQKQYNRIVSYFTDDEHNAILARSEKEGYKKPGQFLRKLILDEIKK